MTLHFIGSGILIIALFSVHNTSDKTGRNPQNSCGPVRACVPQNVTLCLCGGY